MRAALALSDPALKDKFAAWRRTRFLRPEYFRGLDASTGLPGLSRGPVSAAQPSPMPPPPMDGGASESGDWTPVRMSGGVNAEYYLSFLHDYDRYPADVAATQGARALLMGGGGGRLLQGLQAPWLQMPLPAAEARYGRGAAPYAYTSAVLPAIPAGVEHAQPGAVPWMDPHWQAHVAAVHRHQQGQGQGRAGDAARFAELGGRATVMQPEVQAAFHGGAQRPPSAYRAKQAHVEQAARDHAESGAVDAILAAGIAPSLSYAVHSGQHAHPATHAAAAEAAAALHAERVRQHMFAVHDDAGSLM